MGVMSARLGVMRAGADGVPSLPQSATVPGVGVVTVWQDVFDCTVGSCPAREYRTATGEHLVVLVAVAPVGTDVLTIAWVQAPTRDGDNATFDVLAATPEVAAEVVARWDLAFDGEVYTTPTLDADTSPEADAVRAAWPASWYVRLPTDPETGPPTGPRIIGEVIA